jgi:diguanylate cyclase (GGDEF)-like protein
MLTLGLVFAAAVWASRESNAAALDRQRELVDGRLRTQIESVERELDLMGEGFARSLATDMSHNGESDIGESFTSIITSVFAYDEAFVVQSDGHLALVSDAEAASRYDWIKPLLMPMLNRAVSAASAPGEQLTSKTVELMRLQGRPSIAGVVPLAIKAAEPLFLIAYRYIDGPALDAFSRQQGLNGARFARASDPDESEVSFQIDATAGKEPIGFVIWTPDLPGSRVVGRLIPALAGAALIIAALLAVLMLLLLRSLADLQDSERKARHRSLHDVLTGLPNRALFSLRLQQCLEQHRLGQTSTVVALVDLDKFKAVNDTLGHGAGDELIQAVADRISRLLGPEDTLSRLGGDEFALLLPGKTSGDLRYRDFCQAILTELGQPFPLQGGKQTASIGCSIGLTSLHDADHTVSNVLHMADLALYQAKSSGRGRLVEYTPSMAVSAREKDELRTDLSLALDRAERGPGNDGIEVFYQTVHSAGQGHRITGAEALVRWRHEKHGLLTPDRFIPLAEENGLIERLGKLVLKRACLAAVAWPNRGFVSVNVSSSQLRHPEFVDQVVKIVEATALPFERLELEVTETALMNSDEAVVNGTISRLRGYGIKIALDDFGTGYSSLSHLVKFGIDRLKIDRSFVALLGTRADGAAVVSAVIALSKSMGLATTAESVETPAQRDFLQAAGCTELQGFLFARPVPEPSMGTPANHFSNLAV